MSSSHVRLVHFRFELAHDTFFEDACCLFYDPLSVTRVDPHGEEYLKWQQAALQDFLDYSYKKTYCSLMKTTTISAFKAHISENLRAVRAGQHILIMDRSTAIAEVSPVMKRPRPSELQARKKFSIPEAPVLKVKSDANELLALERGER